MKFNDDVDMNAADELATQIESLVNADLDLGHGDILVACMMVMSGVIAAVPCADCRKVTAKSVKQELRRYITDALAKPITTESGSQHLH